MFELTVSRTNFDGSIGTIKRLLEKGEPIQIKFKLWTGKRRTNVLEGSREFLFWFQKLHGIIGHRLSSFAYEAGPDVVTIVVFPSPKPRPSVADPQLAQGGDLYFYAE